MLVFPSCQLLFLVRRNISLTLLPLCGGSFRQANYSFARHSTVRVLLANRSFPEVISPEFSPELNPVWLHRQTNLRLTYKQVIQI